MDKLALTFQSPIYLWGLLSLLIPIAIHFLSKHKGKLVPFAHIALITVKNTAQLNQARLTQWLLLILRLLILLMLCGLLTQAFWKHSTPSDNQAILITADWISQSDDSEKQQLVDSYAANVSGNTWLVVDSAKQVTPLEPFNFVELKRLSEEYNQQQSAHIKPLNLWASVAAISHTLSNKQNFTVFTTNRLNQFSGAKPLIQNPINWKIKPLPVSNIAATLRANVTVVSDNNHQEQVTYLKGAVNALTDTLPVDLSVDYFNSQQIPENFITNLKSDSGHPYIIYLADSAVPDSWTTSNLTIINSQQLEDYKTLAFPLTLASLIFENQTQAWFADNARLSDTQISQLPKVGQQDSQTAVTTGTNLHIYLLLLLVLLLMAERLISEWPAIKENAGEGN
ncbi:BatA domain-containing protein [Paraglaciecola sp. 2405UD69-4]|uniref:BatA domain-containing protein n=1 Tax=Paraglaciecola sp. 2405UD69-4 TaxID=3391836 RepID=UPI0039C94E64